MEKLIEILSPILERSDLTADSSLEWDSMQVVAAIGRIHRAFGVVADPDKLFAAKTVGDVWLAIANGGAR